MIVTYRAIYKDKKYLVLDYVKRTGLVTLGTVDKNPPESFVVHEDDIENVETLNLYGRGC